MKPCVSTIEFFASQILRIVESQIWDWEDFLNLEYFLILRRCHL
jgi:hypothetical protein